MLKEKDDLMRNVDLLILRSARLKRELEINAANMIVKKELELIEEKLNEIKSELLR